MDLDHGEIRGQIYAAMHLWFWPRLIVRRVSAMRAYFRPLHGIAEIGKENASILPVWRPHSCAGLTNQLLRTIGTGRQGDTT